MERARLPHGGRPRKYDDDDVEAVMTWEWATFHLHEDRPTLKLTTAYVRAARGEEAVNRVTCRVRPRAKCTVATRRAAAAKAFCVPSTESPEDPPLDHVKVNRRALLRVLEQAKTKRETARTRRRLLENTRRRLDEHPEIAAAVLAPVAASPPPDNAARSAVQSQLSAYPPTTLVHGPETIYTREEPDVRQPFII
mmetsp:Transcript_11555/g.36726  ORF Transcript_11555/g.36726 Transcript_11555/m.36726 type:complete len:195 (-) Transcript_11555:127-711(-)|eukprot:CAMPEP_0197401282 /NCGR_PEP_ID=MMETSP1165-20131217/18252_1 /TAXON_ID=284809 /ORGANISM="Chrysocystis fragilis, Strain CCMP3189" /LENGTH=194 /DNA_ID=CAMNT_0042927391 /DNA_START=27 /DNA_END=611 /DNA_ORIENTATION=-